ncbi:MAG: glycoside hydrolase family 9 protein [Eubacteriales bacterium]|nr:glycoside hydrolase family 9 protein [Eubacteriales bacterium]
MKKELEKLLHESNYAWKAMKANEDDGASKRMAQKHVHKSLLLSSMESKENIEYVGPGTLSVSNDFSLYDTTSLKLDVPSTLPFKPKSHRSYTRANIVFKGNSADWSEYNRVSVWVYPDCPGSRNVWLSLSMVNGGENTYPRDERFEGVHHINIPNKKWSQISWEIPYIPRDCVSALMIGYNIHGSQPDISDRSVLYFNKLELSLVDAEHYEGWGLGDRIAFCHSGYRPTDKKTAISQGENLHFEILEYNTNQVVFSGEGMPMILDGEKLNMLDFTGLEEEGKYYIQTATTKTKPFIVSNECYDSPTWKIINFFMQERCGFDLPGSHTMCHMDSFCVHPDGRKVLAAGGWHDAGDLSQGLSNTALSVQAMLELADKVRDNEQLFERLLDEARWGLSWMMRTRFGDGFRCMWTTIGLWTQNIVGDVDDLNSEAGNFAGVNAAGAEAEALGARLFRGIDDEYADYCLKCAIEDYDFALEGCKIRASVPGVPSSAFMATGQESNVKGRRKKNYMGNEVMLNGKMATAAIELYKLTGDDKYIQQANEFVDVVLECQQTEYTDWDIPMIGFFYSNREKSVPVAFFHQGHECVFVKPISMMIRFAPENMQNPQWKKSLELYSEYIKKTYEYIQPYGLIPAAIYKIATKEEECEGCILHALQGEAAIKEHNAQVRNGIKLSDEYYLRRFPVAFSLRGYFSVILSKAKAITQTAIALGDDSLLKIARDQIEWILGKNPFARSYMYGEGYDFTPMYTEFMFDMVGEVPVGIQTQDDHDLPFMPVMNAATYYEVWVNSTARLLSTMADLY